MVHSIVHTLSSRLDERSKSRGGNILGAHVYDDARSRSEEYG